jgi:hypothetical protein
MAVSAGVVADADISAFVAKFAIDLGVGTSTSTGIKSCFNTSF